MTQKSRTNAVAAVQKLVENRPAETAAAAVGAIALIVAATFDFADDLTVGLVILLSLLPAVVSYLHDLARGAPAKRAQVDDELNILKVRAIRRLRVGDRHGHSDLEAIKKITAAVGKSDPAPKDGSTNGGPAEPAPPEGSGQAKAPGE